MAVVVSGGLAEQAGKVLGLGETTLTIRGIAEWPILVLIVALVLALPYWAAPNVEHPGFRWEAPGSALAVVLWILASAASGFHVADFGSSGRTCAAMAGVVVFLIRRWITDVAVLLGVEFDAELARERAVREGRPRARSLTSSLATPEVRA